MIMEPIDILFLSHNRLAFTRASLEALITNTQWDRVKRFVWYDDDSCDGTLDLYEDFQSAIPVPVHFWPGQYGSPVTIMNAHLRDDPTPIFAKIDNDVLVPKYWLGELLNVMDRNDDLSFLGLEAFDPVEPGQIDRTYRKARFIGGIGLMRTAAFGGPVLDETIGRYGFGVFQENHPLITKGWLTPALPVFLLDRLPQEPWCSLSRKYALHGWQRTWAPYHAERDANVWPYIERFTYEYGRQDSGDDGRVGKEVAATDR